ncbi:MAG: hypothetical protein GXZ09_04525 [Syntrophomonadaceae bacterium]|nr:hypothetical protein [Syntrophomonadaceae bacterium]
MKNDQQGNAVILVLLIMLVCSAFIMAALNTAYVNGRIVYWDRCSLQAWQAADAGLAWAHCQLAHPSFAPGDSLQAELAFPNGAHCTVSSSLQMVGTDCQYTVTATGSYQGASYQASRNFIIVLPGQETLL